MIFFLILSFVAFGVILLMFHTLKHHGGRYLVPVFLGGVWALFSFTFHRDVLSVTANASFAVMQWYLAYLLLRYLGKREEKRLVRRIIVLIAAFFLALMHAYIQNFGQYL